MILRKYLAALIITVIPSFIHAQIKPRVFVYTDINLVGGDPDDRQSLVHLLWYANELDIAGIVPDYWNGKGLHDLWIWGEGIPGCTNRSELDSQQSG